MSRNRKSVTIHFNIAEWRNLLSLATFYSFKDPRDVVKLAYQQLQQATRDLEKKLKEAQDNAEQNASGADGDSGTAAPADSQQAEGGGVSGAKPAVG